MSEIQMIESSENTRTMSNVPGDNNDLQLEVKSIKNRLNKVVNFYSKYMIEYSWLILALSTLITSGLTIYFIYFMEIRQFDQTDFFIRNGHALKNIKRIKNIFGDDKNLRVHQQMDLYPALDIIIERKRKTNLDDFNQTNMLNQEIIDEIRRLNEQIQEIRVNNSRNPIGYNFSSLCTIINRACVIDGNYLLSEKFRQDALNLPYLKTGMYFDSSNGANGLSSFIFGKDFKVVNVSDVDADYQDEEQEEKHDDDDDDNSKTKNGAASQGSFKEIISYVPRFRIRYALNTSNDEMLQLALKWEREVLHYLYTKYQSDLIEISASTSTAISDAVTKQAHNEGPFLAIMLLIFFVFVCLFLCVQGNFYTSVGYLPLIGIINLVLSTGSTFGLLTLFKIQIIEPMALTVLIMAIIDSMRLSIVCGEYHRIVKEHLPVTSSNIATKIDIERIFSEIIKSSRPYFLSSTLIQVIVYVILIIISPISCIRYLSLTLIIYLFMSYLMHSTFFSSFLVITLKRLKSRRHAFLCYQLSNDNYNNNDKKILFQKQRQYFSNIKNNYKIILSLIVCLITTISFVLSIHLIISIETRLFDNSILPKSSAPLKSYMKSHADHYDLGAIIMFVIPETVNYANERHRASIKHLLQRCLNETTTNQFYLLWLEQEDLNTILTSDQPLPHRLTPYSQNDLVVSIHGNKSLINASRFYCQFKSIKGDSHDLQTMNNMYRYAKQSSIPSIFPYSIVFPHYEALEQIRFDIYTSIIIICITALIILLLMFLSFDKALVISLGIIILYSSTIAYLYLFHSITLNFANALWFHVIPFIYIDGIIHTYFNNSSKWNYNRVIISLLISLVLFSFFPIETYVYHIMSYSLIYQSVVCLLLINIVLPSCKCIIGSLFKSKSLPMKSRINNEKSQLSVNVGEIENLVHEPNGSIATKK